MSRFILGTLLVWTVLFGWVFEVESKPLTFSSCIGRIRSSLEPSSGRVVKLMGIGNKSFYFTPSPGKIRMGSGKFLTPNQLAAIEPVLAAFRSAAIAKVRVRIRYDLSTRWVGEYTFLYDAKRCP